MHSPRWREPRGRGALAPRRGERSRSGSRKPLRCGAGRRRAPLRDAQRAAGASSGAARWIFGSRAHPEAAAPCEGVTSWVQLGLGSPGGAALGCMPSARGEPPSAPRCHPDGADTSVTTAAIAAVVSGPSELGEYSHRSRLLEVQEVTSGARACPCACRLDGVNARCAAPAAQRLRIAARAPPALSRCGAKFWQDAGRMRVGLSLRRPAPRPRHTHAQVLERGEPREGVYRERHVVNAAQGERC
jgi:hypothetical protein